MKSRFCGMGMSEFRKSQVKEEPNHEMNFEYLLFTDAFMGKLYSEENEKAAIVM